VVVMMDLARSSWWSRNDPEFEAAFDSGFRKKLTLDDRVVVGSSAASIRLPESWPSDPNALQHSVRAAMATPGKERYGNSLIWDGVDRAVALLTETPATSRRGIILITDGHAAGNRTRPDVVAAHAREANVAIYVVFREAVSRALPQTSGGVFYARPELGLKVLSDTTGGTLVAHRADASLEIQRVLLAAITAIRQER